MHALHQSRNLGILHWYRVVATPHEAGDPRSVAHHTPGIPVGNHPNEDVAGVDLLFLNHALAALDANLLLGWDNDFENLILHAERLDALIEIALDRVLVSCISMDSVPARILLSRFGFVAHFFG